MCSRGPTASSLFALLAALLPGLALGASVASEAQTLGVTAALNQRLPAACEFTVPTAGQVQVALTDLANPVAFTQLRLVVSRGADKVASLAAPGVQQFAAQSGVHKVQVVGTPGQPAGGDPAGAYDVEVRTVAGNTLLGTCPGGILGATADPSQSILNTTFQIAQPGTYQVTLNDRVFPAALANIDLLLSREGGGGSSVILGPSCAVTACTQSLVVSVAGTYRLLVFAAAANPHQAGLYSLSVAGGPGNATVYATSQPVGRLPAPADLVVPAAGAYSLSASDLAVPVALADLRVVLTQGAGQLGTLAAPGSLAVTAAAGNAQLFVFSRVASGAGAGAGIYAVGVAQGTQAIYRDVRALPEGFDPAVNYGGYRYAFTIPAAGAYRLQLRDLNFPGLFGQLRAVLVQNGVVVQNLTGATSGVTVQLDAGPAFLAVVGSPAAAANSLLGLSLAPQAGGAALLDQAQGVGPLYATRIVNIPAAGSYDLIINDLNFPVAFAELAVAVTQGPNLIAQIFGSGQVRFTAQAGTHSISLLARPEANAQFATWGYSVSDSPPLPTVTLGATPASVTRDGTVTLAWSSTNASTCAATGGWTGTRTLSGSESSVALTVDTTFTLTCTGAGGSTSRSVSVTVSAPASGGGGGSLGGAGLLLLAALLYGLRRRGSAGGLTRG